MPASRYDLEWDRRGDWEIVVGRRTRSNVVLPAASGVLEVRAVDEPSSTPALLTLTGTVTPEKRVALRATVEQQATLPGSYYEYVAVLTDESSGRRLPLLRGYLSLTDSVGDG